MNLGAFLRQLQSSGHVAVGRDPAVPHGDITTALAAADAAVRLDGPAGLPALDVRAATWATERLHAGCAAFVHRDLDAAATAARLSEPCPSPTSAAATHYSADLAFRHLPELLQLARGLAPQDPLVQQLRQLAAAWPLSSVGMPGLAAVDAAPLCTNAGLLRLYVDRILRHGDRSRCNDAAVAAAVAAAVGEHVEWARSVLDLVATPRPETHAP